MFHTVLGRRCGLRQLRHLVSFCARDEAGIIHGIASYEVSNAAALRRNWSSTLSSTSRLLNSEVHHTYASRPTFQPGREPGLDPTKPNDEEHPLIPHADCEITVVDFNEERIQTQNFNNASLLEWLGKQKSQTPWAKCRWINVNGLSWDVIQALGKYKNLHRLAVEDLVHRETRTKADWYSDHVYISLTLQKLVRPLDLSTIDPKVLSNLGLSSRHQQSSKSPSDHLFRRRTPESDTQSKTSSHGGFVLAQQKGLDHTTPRKLRTLQGYRYRGALNADRIEFMEARSPLTKMDLAVSAEQVSMFLMSDNTVISFFESSAADIETPILSRLNTQDTILRKSCDASMITQAIIDTIIDHALPVALTYKDVIGSLELQVLTEPDIDHARDLYVITSEIAAMRDFITPIASLVASLHGQSSTERSSKSTTLHDQRSSSSTKISPTTKTYLGDVSDHCYLILQTFDQLQHSAQGMIELIFHTISARQNESMKQLTAATIIFLPLTFITGYFGMNLTDFPNLEHSELWFWSIAAPIATGTVLLLARKSVRRSFLRFRRRRHRLSS